MSPRDPFAAARSASDDGVLRALRRRRRRRRLRMGAVWTAAGAVAVALGVGLFFGWHAGLGWVRTHTRLLEVRKVQPDETLSIPTWDLVDATGVVPGDDLLEVAPDSIETKLRRLPRVADAEVTRQPGGTVRVSVVEREPVAICLADHPIELDARGNILGPAPAPGDPLWPGAESRRGSELPILSGVDLRGYRDGDVLANRGARRALAFLSRLRAYGYDGSGWVSEVRAENPDDLVLYTLDNGVEVRIGDGRLSRTKLRAFFEVLSRVRDHGPAVRSVDLRFHNQVVVRRG